MTLNLLLDPPVIATSTQKEIEQPSSNQDADLKRAG